MAKKEKTVSSVFFNGILNENPTLRLVLGICPTLCLLYTSPSPRDS